MAVPGEEWIAVPGEERIAVPGEEWIAALTAHILSWGKVLFVYFFLDPGAVGHYAALKAGNGFIINYCIVTIVKIRKIIFMQKFKCFTCLELYSIHIID